jgi:hypothetical protein
MKMCSDILEKSRSCRATVSYTQVNDCQKPVPDPQ